MEKYNEANVGGGWFSVLWSDWMDRAPGSASGVVFEVDDIDNTVADLRGKGVEVEDVYERRFARSLPSTTLKATKSHCINARYLTRR